MATATVAQRSAQPASPAKGSPVTLAQWSAFETELGWMGIVFDEVQLHRVDFGHESFDRLIRSFEARDVNLSHSVDRPTGWARDCVSRLEQFATGKSQSFSSVPLAVDHLTPFGLKVLNACRKIEWGQLLTYRELATSAGSPNAARAIGNVMASNRFPLVVPCHRVVGSGGGLGGYSAPGGLKTKLHLLKREGYNQVAGK